jgi:hypothetical protein
MYVRGGFGVGDYTVEYPRFQPFVEKVKTPKEILKDFSPRTREAFLMACATGCLDHLVSAPILRILVRNGFFDEKSWKVTPLGYEAIGVVKRVG